MAEIPEFRLETPRLILTFLDPDNTGHCTFLAQLFNEPIFSKYQGGSSQITPEAAAAFIRNRCLYQYQNDHYGRAIMYLKPGTSSKTSPPLSSCQPIGLISMVKGTDEHSYTIPDVGFSVLKEYNGKGYATEGARAMIDYVVNDLKIEGVFGFTNEENIASQRVLEKLGLQNRGLHNLRAFGPDAKGLVYASVGVGEDLGVYNLKD